MTSRAETWRWSSAGAYICSSEGPRWLKTDYILELFGPLNHAANFREFMVEGIDLATTKFYADLGR